MNFCKDRILLFDGACNLCNGSVQFVIKRDKKAKVKFASLQSDTGQKIMLENKIPNEYIDSIIFFENNRIYYKSTAALKLFKQLDGIWSWIYVLIILPRFFRDFVYDFIAKNRIKWFGKAETCWVMTADYKKRFV